MLAFFVGLMLGFVIGIFVMIVGAVILVQRGDDLEDEFRDYKEDWK